MGRAGTTGEHASPSRNCGRSAAHNALLAVVEPDYRPLDPKKEPVKGSPHARAAAFLRTIWDAARGHFSDAPCAIVHYAQAYDWMASVLTPQENQETRKRLAKAVQERVARCGTTAIIGFAKVRPRPARSRSTPCE